MSPLFSIPFLGQALSSTLVYIWSRRNPDTRLSFLGLVVFRAPFLPWVLILFSLVTHGQLPKDEICGIIVGHSEYMRIFFVVVPRLNCSAVYYFFNDVFPPMYDGFRPLDPPTFWVRLFDGRRDVGGTNEEVRLNADNPNNLVAPMLPGVPG